uniref:Uncharacterized protein n=1 Tax=Chromera velia CCMP2878 TaxID=1169474 RepID=A0A0G4FA86_9ALVE|eukprot:Cvel_16024.t1-p1 / transcript=Cvel_16024.t1 / gene=Cvel_16024 / organism=Chromera_velia_CCMP2878 / gene_product=hypothetical protein / transcript_product=hypothetical protein / location=Cvel_scaffold1216:21698-23791(-) / protein_length=178 / sequence_SO=supercontig / SO=protein_coding / is_pseudo=false
MGNKALAFDSCMGVCARDRPPSREPSKGGGVGEGSGAAGGESELVEVKKENARLDKEVRLYKHLLAETQRENEALKKEMEKTAPLDGKGTCLHARWALSNPITRQQYKLLPFPASARLHAPLNVHTHHRTLPWGLVLLLIRRGLQRLGVGVVEGDVLSAWMFIWQQCASCFSPRQEKG